MLYLMERLDMLETRAHYGRAVKCVTAAARSSASRRTVAGRHVRARHIDGDMRVIGTIFRRLRHG